MMCFLFTKSLYKQNWNLVKVTLIPSKNHAKFSAEKNPKWKNRPFS